MAKSGYDISSLDKKIDALNVLVSYEPIEPLAETDLDGFLRHYKEQIFLTAIEEPKAKCIESFQSLYEGYQHERWHKNKADFLQSVGYGIALGTLALSAKLTKQKRANPQSRDKHKVTRAVRARCACALCVRMRAAHSEFQLRMRRPPRQSFTFESRKS